MTLTEKKLPPEGPTDVHTSHCCVRHGCKYGHDDCVVKTGKVRQEYHCEDCYYGIGKHLPVGVKEFRVSFDIGGVLSKYPEVFRPMLFALQRGGTSVYVLTDMRDHDKAVKFVQDNGYDVPEENVLCANYDEHGESCKAVLIEENEIDVHIDDFPGYCANTKCVNLFVWPNADKPYYADDFKTDGSEGKFGRTKKSKFA